MKLILTLTTDEEVFITQVSVSVPDTDLQLEPLEFNFRNCMASKAIEALQASAQVERAINKRKAGVCHDSSNAN